MSGRSAAGPLTSVPHILAAAAYRIGRTGLLAAFNPLEFRGNYSATSNNNDVGTLAVDGWAVTFGTVRRGLGGGPGPSSLYQM